MIKQKKGLAALAAVLVVAISAIGAYAYWTSGGTGTGSATAGTTADVTVVQDSVTASNLYPGGPAEALSGHFLNPNPGSVNIATVTAAVTAVTSGAGPGPVCTTADFSIVGNPIGPYVALANDTTTWSGLSVRLDENGFNQDNCKSSVVTITYTANGV